ncbi:hypothetical protein [Micropruina sp.]|uniref:hypothetical protein n=1 Tax=Micropruina sp. TaxID=2737536 RepID=UPI0039E71FB7
MSDNDQHQQRDRDAHRRRLLLVGHGLLAGHAPSAQGPGLVPEVSAPVALYQLPAPAFAQRPQVSHGVSRPPQVAERLAELDELERVFEDVAGLVDQGYEVIGLAVPGRLVNSRSGRAWLDRVRTIAHTVAGLTPEVWTVTAGQAAPFDPTAQPIRTAS